MDAKLGLAVLALALAGCEIELGEQVHNEPAKNAPRFTFSTHTDLETRTFALDHIDADYAAELIDPYVYRDRLAAPGTVSSTHDAISVRETPDNLDKIARMLDEFDVAAEATASYRLHFQIVAANGGDSDARLATVEAALREVFRFDGYSLVGEGYVTASAGSFDLTTNAAGGEHAGLYGIDGRIHGDKLALDVHGPRIEFADGRWTNGRINTTLAFRPGQTLVLGSMPTPDRTVFIVVRIEADAEPV